MNTRATKAWARAESKARETNPLATVAPIGLHGRRHTCASIFIDAGVNAKALSTYLGHSSTQITFAGNEDEAARLVDAYLGRATGASSGAQQAQGGV